MHLRPLIIAEIGQNHNGDSYTALRLVKAAIDAGADAVKFQLRDRHAEYTEEQLAAPHPLPEHAFGKTYGEHRAALDLTPEDLRHIVRRIRWNNWDVYIGVTPCHVSVVKHLEELELDFWKIASKDCASRLLYNQCAASAPVLLASIPNHYQVQWWHRECADVLLHCVQEYPTALSDANLQRIQKEDLQGWSDHTGTPYLGAAAVPFGAEVFEAHITFSQQCKGRDHRASLDPGQFRAWAAGIRAAWLAVHGSAKEGKSGRLCEMR